MRIRQYVYFELFSRTTTAQQMTDRLSLSPDEISVMGSRRSDPAIPVTHAWRLVCREPGLCVDEQITQVMERLRPQEQQVVELARDLERADPGRGGAGLSIVRYLNDDTGEEEVLSPTDAQLQKLPGQHQLLGWVLEPEVMRFLLAANANVDVDEYG